VKSVLIHIWEICGLICSQRHDTEEELAVLNGLYDYPRLYTNFYQPVMKLTEKTRIGSKVKKKYDWARTP